MTPAVAVARHVIVGPEPAFEHGFQLVDDGHISPRLAAQEVGNSLGVDLRLLGDRVDRQAFFGAAFVVEAPNEQLDELGDVGSVVYEVPVGPLLAIREIADRRAFETASARHRHRQ